MGFRYLCQAEGEQLRHHCLTPEAQESPWLLFQAGALSKLEGSRVWTYLFDVPKDAVVAPLQQFQHTDATEGDTLQLLRTINSHLVEGRLEEAKLQRLFTKNWSDLEKVLQELPTHTNAIAETPSANELIPQIFEHVRAQGEQVQKLTRYMNAVFDHPITGGDSTQIDRSILMWNWPE